MSMPQTPCQMYLPRHIDETTDSSETPLGFKYVDASGSSVVAADQCDFSMPYDSVARGSYDRILDAAPRDGAEFLAAVEQARSETARLPKAPRPIAY